MHSCQIKSKFVNFFALDCSGADHLLSEVVLVLGDGTVPCADSLVLTDENLLGNLVEQSIIVSHHSLQSDSMVLTGNREKRR